MRLPYLKISGGTMTRLGLLGQRGRLYIAEHRYWSAASLSGGSV